MLAKVYSCAVVGLDGVLVEVEVDVGPGMPGMTLVGLPDAAVSVQRLGRALAARRLTDFGRGADDRRQGQRESGGR